MNRVSSPILFLALLLSACSSGQIPLAPIIDTPRYHVKTGEKMLEFYKTDSAFREFSRALELDPRYPPALIGLSLTQAIRGNYDEGLATLEKADRYARGKEQEVAANVGYMRFYLIAGHRYAPDWLQHVEVAYDRAMGNGHDQPAPYYFMGMAYKTAGKFDQAAKKFYRVLELDRGFVKAADEEFAAIEKRIAE